MMNTFSQTTSAYFTVIGADIQREIYIDAASKAAHTWFLDTSSFYVKIGHISCPVRRHNGYVFTNARITLARAMKCYAGTLRTKSAVKVHLCRISRRKMHTPHKAMCISHNYILMQAYLWGQQTRPMPLQMHSCARCFANFLFFYLQCQPVDSK